MNPKPWLAFTMSLCQLPEAAETTVLGGWVSSDHLLDMSPFWTRPCLAVPSTTYQAKQMRPLKMMTTPKAVALPYSLSWDYYF